MISEREAELVRSWHRECFKCLGFDEPSIETLVAWGSDPHVVTELLFRDGERTSCRHDQALRIVQPDEDYLVLTAEFEALVA